MMNAISWYFKRKFPFNDNITTDELDEKLKNSKTSSSCIILDTRTENEFNVSHLPNAIHINNWKDKEEIKKIVESKQDVDKCFYCYCSAGYRGNRVVELIDKEYNTELNKNVCVKNIEGGIFSWANAGKEMVDKNNQKTIYCHPFSKNFQYLLKSNLRKWE
ncbi:hypothetical protein ABK040_003255 [Willaertia magna]